jgi:hypothetical protein
MMTTSKKSVCGIATPVARITGVLPTNTWSIIHAADIRCTTAIKDSMIAIAGLCRIGRGQRWFTVPEICRHGGPIRVHQSICRSRDTLGEASTIQRGDEI